MRRWLPLALGACVACRDERAATAFARDVERLGRAYGASLARLECHAYDRDAAVFCTARATPDEIARLARGLALEPADPLARAPFAVFAAGGCSDQPGFHAPAAVETHRPSSRSVAHDGLRVATLLYASERGAACVEIARVGR